MVNSKTCLVQVDAEILFLFIQRFFCKECLKTFSLLPDFLHPRKRYTQKYVTLIFELILEKRNSLKSVSKKMKVHYQTIQKWLANFSKGREVKAVCFSHIDTQSEFFNAPKMEYALKFWQGLRGHYGSPLIESTVLLWGDFTRTLY